MVGGESVGDDLIVLATFGFRHEAELAASALRGEGIPCLVRDGYFAGLDPIIMLSSGGVPLLVKAEDREHAVRVLGRLDAQE